MIVSTEHGILLPLKDIRFKTSLPKCPCEINARPLPLYLLLSPNILVMSFSHICRGFAPLLFPATITCIIVSSKPLYRVTWPKYVSVLEHTRRMWRTGRGKCLESWTDSRRSADVRKIHQGSNVRKRIIEREREREHIINSGQHDRKTNTNRFSNDKECDCVIQQDVRSLRYQAIVALGL